MSNLYHLPAARSEEQKQNMIDLESRGVCIFCPEHIAEDTEPVEIETSHWMVKKNKFPYKSTRVHMLVIPKQHVHTMTELDEAAQIDFYNALKQCEERYSMTSYGLVARSGDMAHNAGSIAHLHIHLVVGDTENPDHEPVRVKISSRY